MATTYTHLRVHFVWSTKNRAPLIDESFESDLFKTIGGILKKRKHILLAAGGTADHVHLLVGQHPTESVSDLARDVKTNSSAWIHQEIPNLQGFSWQEGYGAFSVSKSAESTVNEYIQDQKQHHQKYTYKQELLGLLRRHEIEYDERYIWD